MSKIINKKGQVLLFVIVILTVALSVGVAVSSRTLASLSRSTRQDTANKAQAAAESGIETYLSKSKSELDTLMSSPPQEINLEDPVSKINTKAVVTVSQYKTTTEKGLEYSINPDEIREVKFKGQQPSDNFNGDITICWNGPGTALQYYLYDDSGVFENTLVMPSNTTVLLGNNIQSTKTATSSAQCDNLSTVTTNNATGLRLKPLYNAASVIIKPVSGELPYQGHKIVSEGSLVQEGKVLSTKRVTVFKPYPYLIGLFDNAMYTQVEFNN